MGLIFGEAFEPDALQSSSQVAYKRHNAGRPYIIRKNANYSEALVRTEASAPQPLPKNLVDVSLKPAMAAVRNDSLRRPPQRNLPSQVDCSVPGAKFVARTEYDERSRAVVKAAAQEEDRHAMQQRSSFAPARNPVTGQLQSGPFSSFERPDAMNAHGAGHVSLDSAVRASQRTYFQ